MATRLAQVVFDAIAPRDLAGFWAAALDWRVVIDEPDEVEIAGSDDDVDLGFVPTSDAKVTKNRLHLDVTTSSDDHYRDTVERLLELGATPADIGQGPDVFWTVLADPEGNEFCVLPPSPGGADHLPLGVICLDAAEPSVMGPFWSAATGWPMIRCDNVAILQSPGGPAIAMGPKVAPKMGKNRLHIDVAPFVDDNQGAEVERLVALGATHVDIGQGDVPWVVLADPEGNEFCVLTPR